ncbi:MAG: C40 family peptidase [Muribaculaceae bacterium]|nr:C40 family peptidase [Muribaculaceae bacterium]
MLLVSCHTSKSNKTPDYRKKEETVIHIQGKNKRGKKVVEEALEWIGTPYQYAKAEKGAGTDCSGLVMMSYLEATGLKLPRNSAKQAEFCKKISSSDVQIGDLCFFATGKDPNRISHVGIMIDNETFIHASSKKGVITTKINSPYYVRTFIQFGRVPD